MTIRQIINIVGGSIIAALIVTVIILSCIVSSQGKTIAIIRNDRNYLSQTLDKMKLEAIKQSEIYAEKDELLLEVKNSKTLKEYLVVWDKVNKSLK